MSPSACFHASGSFSRPRAIWMPRSLSSCHRPACNHAQGLEIWGPSAVCSLMKQTGSPQMQQTGWPRQVETSMALLTRCRCRTHSPPPQPHPIHVGVYAEEYGVQVMCRGMRQRRPSQGLSQGCRGQWQPGALKTGWLAAGNVKWLWLLMNSQCRTWGAPMMPFAGLPRSVAARRAENRLARSWGLNSR